jgi:tetratricopeptide (TPR) repeat protein
MINLLKKISTQLVLVVLGLSLTLPLGAAPVEAYRSYITGLLALRQGDAKSALESYQKVMVLDSHATLIYRDLVFIYWQLGMTNEALAAADKLETEYPADLSTQLLLGNFYLYAGQTARARAAWEKALTIDPANETAMLYLAAYHSSDNDPDKSIAYWKKYLAQEPESADAYYQMGLMQDKSGKTDEARESVRKAISLKPTMAEAHIVLAQFYEKEGKLLGAAAEYEQYLKLVPDNSTILFYLGGLYYRSKNFQAANDIFLRARELNPADTNVLFWLGIVAEAQKDWGKATQYLEEIRKKEESPLILTRLSYYYSVRKDYGTAIKYLKKAAQLDARNPNAYYLLALAYMDAGKFRAAEKAFRYTLTLKPGMEEALFHLAILYDQRGKFDDAVREVREVLAIDPKHAPALNFLGYSYADRGIQLEQDPDNGSYMDSLGWVHFKMGRSAESEKELQLAADKYPDPIIFDHLGDVRMKLGKNAEAWDAYQKALEGDPSNKTIRKKIRDMEKLVLPGTLQRKLLKRAAGNFLQIGTLSLNFSVQGHARDINFRFFGLFQYLRPELWRVDILGNFMAPQVVLIQNGGLQVHPQAMAANLSPESVTLFDQVRDLLNARLLDEFDHDGVTATAQGRCLLYRSGDKSLLIDRDSATVREYTVKDRLVLKFKSHLRTEGLDLPAEIDMYAPREKTTTTIKLHDFKLNKDIDENVFTLRP